MLSLRHGPRFCKIADSRKFIKKEIFNLPELLTFWIGSGS